MTTPKRRILSFVLTVLCINIIIILIISIIIIMIKGHDALLISAKIIDVLALRLRLL